MSEVVERRDAHTPPPESDKNPAVSVVIPAYNAGALIGETLDSVLAQTFKDYEIVVVNDGSPDTVELERALGPYRERIVYVRQENGGPGRARNTAIGASRGKYVALLDADDLWEPEYLETQIAMLEEDPSLDVVYSNGLIFGDGPDVGREMMEAFPSEGEVTFESVVAGRCTVLICAVMRREAVVRAGMFDEHFRGVEDFDLWVRILGLGGRIAYHRRPLMRYRRVGGSLSSSAVRMYGQALEVFEKAERTLTALTPADRAALAEAKARYRAMLRLAEGKEALARNDFRAAASGLGEANKYFRSRKIGVILLLLRFAPKLLQGAYQFRNRYLLRGEARV